MCRPGPGPGPGPPSPAHEGYTTIFYGAKDPLCGVMQYSITPWKLYYCILSYVAYHPILWCGRWFLWGEIWPYTTCHSKKWSGRPIYHSALVALLACMKCLRQFLFWWVLWPPAIAPPTCWGGRQISFVHPSGHPTYSGPGCQRGQIYCTHRGNPQVPPICASVKRWKDWECDRAYTPDG